MRRNKLIYLDCGIFLVLSSDSYYALSNIANRIADHIKDHIATGRARPAAGDQDG